MKNRLLLFLFLVLSAYSYGQNCAVSVSISQSAPTLCSGYSVTFTASASGGAAPYTYVWSTGETTPTITVDKAGTYTVIATDKSGKCQGTKNISITSQATPDAPTAPGRDGLRQLVRQPLRQRPPAAPTNGTTPPAEVIFWLQAPPT